MRLISPMSQTHSIQGKASDSYICKAGMDVVFNLTLQCNSPVFSYSTKKIKFQDFQQELYAGMQSSPLWQHCSIILSMYPFSSPPCTRIQTESFILWYDVIATLSLQTAHQPLFILQQFIIRGHHTGFLAVKKALHTSDNDPLQYKNPI